MKLTIITAVLNAGEHIHLCLDSIRKQNVRAEHIIIDGGSTDHTLNIIAENKISPAQIVSEPDKGIYDALNKGIQLASGEIIGILHADDFYAGSDVLAKIVEVFSSPKVDSCYGDLVYVDQKDTAKITRYWRSGSYDRRKFYNGWMPPHPTFFVRRSVYKKYGPFNLNLGTAADYELMLRFLLKHNISCKYIPEVLVHMRNGGRSNASLKNRLAAHRNDYLAWKVNGLRPYPWTIMMKPLRKIRQYITRPDQDGYDTGSFAGPGVESGTAAAVNDASSHAAGLGASSGIAAGAIIESEHATRLEVEPGTAVGLGAEPKTNTGVGIELEAGLNKTVSG